MLARWSGAFEQRFRTILYEGAETVAKGKFGGTGTTGNWGSGILDQMDQGMNNFNNGAYYRGTGTKAIGNQLLLLEVLDILRPMISMAGKASLPKQLANIGLKTAMWGVPLAQKKYRQEGWEGIQDAVSKTIPEIGRTIMSAGSKLQRDPRQAGNQAVQTAMNYLMGR